jgi:hypothetical protein
LRFCVSYRPWCVTNCNPPPAPNQIAAAEVESSPVIAGVDWVICIHLDDCTTGTDCMSLVLGSKRGPFLGRMECLCQLLAPSWDLFQTAHPWQGTPQSRCVGAGLDRAALLHQTAQELQDEDESELIDASSASRCRTQEEVQAHADVLQPAVPLQPGPGIGLLRVFH